MLLLVGSFTEHWVITKRLSVLPVLNINTVVPLLFPVLCHINLPAVNYYTNKCRLVLILMGFDAVFALIKGMATNGVNYIPLTVLHFG